MEGGILGPLAAGGLGYPQGDTGLIPLRDQVFDWLLDADRLKRIPLIDGRYRRCALQESAIVFSMIKLDLVDRSALKQLIELLLKWQWPDGGWNCDKKPAASHSSFHESLIPLRAIMPMLIIPQTIWRKQLSSVQAIYSSNAGCSGGKQMETSLTATSPSYATRHTGIMTFLPR